MDRIKGLELFMSAAKHARKKIPNLKLVIIGPNLNNSNLRLIKNLEKNGVQDISIILGKQINVEEVFLLIDYLALTSYSEGFPNTIGECMSAQIPCVSTNVGDCKYIIGNTGWVTKKNSLKELIYTLKKAVKISRKENKWQKIKIDCSKRIKDVFNYEKEIKKYKNFYQSLK